MRLRLRARDSITRVMDSSLLLVVLRGIPLSRATVRRRPDNGDSNLPRAMGVLGMEVLLHRDLRREDIPRMARDSRLPGISIPVKDGISYYMRSI